MKVLVVWHPAPLVPLVRTSDAVLLATCRTYGDVSSSSIDARFLLVLVFLWSYVLTFAVRDLWEALV